MDLTDAFFPARLPRLHAVRRHLEARVPARVAAAVLAHLAAPIRPAAELADLLGGGLDTIRQAYAVCRTDQQVATLVTSGHYPHRLRWQAATATLAEWTEDPQRPARLLAGEPVIARTVELHPSRGTCNYSCAMCLWSDKQELTYANRDLRADGLLSVADWQEVLDDLYEAGARTVVFSGGGEVLLNNDVGRVMAHARALGLRTQLYTTGFHATPGTPLWEELARLDYIRFSIHSPDPDTYNELVRLPARLHALDRVAGHARALLDQRRATGRGPRLGAGFVVQPLNYRQISDMARWSARLGLDFLHLRKDEVDVTDGLTPDQQTEVATQLRQVRATAEAGGYDSTIIDLGDELVALTDNLPVDRTRTSECLAKVFRPTISPYGLAAPCDLKAEPRFADGGVFDLGQVRGGRTLPVLSAAADRHVPDTCNQCMPSSRTGNAVHHKLLADLRAGLRLDDEPFATTASD